MILEQQKAGMLNTIGANDSKAKHLQILGKAAGEKRKQREPPVGMRWDGWIDGWADLGLAPSVHASRNNFRGHVAVDCFAGWRGDARAIYFTFLFLPM